MTMLRRSLQARLDELLGKVRRADLNDRELMQLVVTLEPALTRIAEERRPVAPVVALVPPPGAVADPSPEKPAHSQAGDGFRRPGDTCARSGAQFQCRPGG